MQNVEFYAACLTCRKRHAVQNKGPLYVLENYAQFVRRHDGHDLQVFLPKYPRTLSPEIILGLTPNATIQLSYGTSNQTITITPASLGNGSSRESTSIDNDINKFIDALVGGKITTGTTPTVDNVIEFYAYGTVDGGTFFSGDATGTDAAYSGRRQNLFLAGVVSVSASSNITYEFGPFSIAAAFGGVLPSDWGIVIRNTTGAALHATGGNHDINFQGVEAESV